MRRLIKWGGIALGSVLILLAVAATVVYVTSNARFNRVYGVALSPVAIPADSASLATGRHLATIRGCVDCHGENLGGTVFIEEPPLGRLVASNLTSGEGGVGASYVDDDWVRAIRHGIRPDGKPLLFMPSYEYFPIDDTDLAALIAYLKTLPPVDNTLPASYVGPLGRILYLTGELPLISAEIIDHEAPRMPAPPVGRTAAYGQYLAVTCTGCHGEGFSGGKIPGTPPDWPPAMNITMDPETGIGNWSEEDFFAALRTGLRPDGTELTRPYMPWNITAQMTDVELGAIWEYLRTLPAKPEGNR
jgi:mono/diheme cytochrome c family protein